MVKFLMFITLFSGAFLFAAEPEPQHHWNFEKKGSSGRCDDVGDSPTKAPIYCMQEAGYGFANSGGVVCKSENLPTAPKTPLDYSAYTVELKFKLDKPFEHGKSRGLFNYEFWSWNRRSFRVRIDQNGALEMFAQVTGEDKKTPKLHFLMTSKPLSWQVGKWYTLRFAGEKGKVARIWLDGKLVAAKNNAPGWDEINDNIRHEYDHLVRLGWDTTQPRLAHGALDGVIDDVKIWDRAIAPDNSVGISGTPGTGVQLPSQAYYTLIGSGVPVWTGKFDVPDKAGHAYGSKERQEAKFLNAAATAAITMDKENFIVHFNCPVPAGMKAVTNARGIWDGDNVEFFLRPDQSSSVYYQYCAGANGKSRAIRYTSRAVEDKSFKSRAKFEVDASHPEKFTLKITIPKAEVNCDKLERGAIISGNFCRSGVTAGGLTSWVPMANDFHSIDSFGNFVVDSYREGLNYAVQKIRQELNILKGDEQLRKQLEEQISRQEKENALCGDNPARFEKLYAGIENLKISLLSFAQSGKTYLLWQADMWGNRFEPNLCSEPVRKIKFTAAQNSRVLYGMAFSNLTDKPFMGLIKCFDQWPLQSGDKNFWNEPYNDFLRNITFYEGLPLQDAGGKPLYDPMAPLLLKSIIRVPEHGTIPLWMTISTRGMKPGNYHAVLVVKPSYAGFPVETIDLELEVLPIDLGTVKEDNFHYAFFTERYVNNKNYANIIKFYRYLVDKEANVMFAGHFREVYPDMNEDGSLKPIDFSLLDKKIETYLKAGTPPDRLKLMFNLHNFIFIWDDVNGKAHKPRHAFGTPEWERGFKEFIAKVYAHMGQKFGLSPERIIIYTGDEPEGDINNKNSRLYRVWYLGKLVHQAVPNAFTATNPFPRQGIDEKYVEAMNKIAATHNIVILIPRAKTPQMLELCKKKGLKIWTYAVYNKVVTPEIYRHMFFDSFREGCEAPNAYWAIDHYAGEGFDSTDFSGNGKGCYTTERIDYGSAYCDMNLGNLITGRRAEAHYQGLLDYKAMSLAKELIDKQKNPAPWRTKLNDIIERGRKGSCTDMDQCHQQLLNLIQQLKQN